MVQKTDTPSTSVSDKKDTPTQPKANFLSSYLAEHTAIAKTADDDTLIDIHVGNPLQRIIEILQDIKRQKAFSFTIKGSVGIMGVALVFSTLGIFGGNKILCDKGVQSEMGTVKILQVIDIQEEIPVIHKIISLFRKDPQNTRPPRVVLQANRGLIQLDFASIDTARLYNDQPVFVTGSFNSCNNVMKVTADNAIEPLR